MKCSTINVEGLKNHTGQEELSTGKTDRASFFIKICRTDSVIFIEHFFFFLNFHGSLLFFVSFHLNCYVMLSTAILESPSLVQC